MFLRSVQHTTQPQVKHTQFIKTNPTTNMADIGAQLNSLSPEQRQAVMMQAQQEANQSIMQELMKEMVTTCFEKCSGTSVCILYIFIKRFVYFFLLRLFSVLMILFVYSVLVLQLFRQHVYFG